MSKPRPWTRVQPCALCSAPVRTPAGTDAEYELVLPSKPTPPPSYRPQCYLVCGECAAANPGIGVREALSQRYGDDYAPWTSPEALPPMLDEAAEYLASHEARDGMDFGSWQKMQDCLKWL